MGLKLPKENTNETGYSSFDIKKYNIELFKNNSLNKSNKKKLDDLINTLFNDRTIKKNKELYILELQYNLVINAHIYFVLKDLYWKIKPLYCKLNGLRKYILKYREDIK